MGVVTAEEVQQWLDNTKMAVSTVDANLEATFKAKVYSRLASIYDTSTWVDVASTPTLIRQIISAYIAAWTYDRQYSEADPDGNAYARRIARWADEQLENIAQGELDLTEVAGFVTVTQPSYHPEDATGAGQQYDEAGYAVGDVYSGRAKFRMGDRF